MAGLVLYTNKLTAGLLIVILSVVDARGTRGISKPWFGPTISKRAEGWGLVVPIPTFF